MEYDAKTTDATQIPKSIWTYNKRLNYFGHPNYFGTLLSKLHIDRMNLSIPNYIYGIPK